jgi:acid stress-induced BolA-like protein IbaG/YrbA
MGQGEAALRASYNGAMSPEEVSRRIQAALPGAVARVHSEDNVHFSAIVIAAQFSGLRTLERHQLVYRALGHAVGGEIHALSLDTLTPAEWADRGGA